jgi:hypothetical protein
MHKEFRNSLAFKCLTSRLILCVCRCKDWTDSPSKGGLGAAGVHPVLVNAIGIELSLEWF